MVTWLDIDADDAPRVALIDVTLEGLDRGGAEERARELGAAVGAGAVSRSYCHPYALVAWHTGPVGVDIERIVACDEQFARSICTPTEHGRTPWANDREIVSLWSGKEALAKALGDAVALRPAAARVAGELDGTQLRRVADRQRACAGRLLRVGVLAHRLKASRTRITHLDSPWLYAADCVLVVRVMAASCP